MLHTQKDLKSQGGMYVFVIVPRSFYDEPCLFNYYVWKEDAFT